MSQIILAVDPGASGGFAVRDSRGEIAVSTIPAIKTELTAYLRSLSDCQPLRGPRDDCGVRVVIEQVGGFIRGKEGQQPGSHMFNFGCGYGFILGCCMAMGYSIEFVQPRAWQKMFNVPQSKGVERKRYLKEIAAAHYPDLGRKVTLKTCDALLILCWAIEQNE